MSDFDKLIRNIARAKAKFDTLADRARECDQDFVDEIIDALRSYSGDDTNTYEGESTASADSEHAEKPHHDGIDKAISDYRNAKRRMESIIDRRMQEAFAEIQQEYGATPVQVDLQVIDKQQMGEKYANGVYAGCKVRMDGE